MRSTILIGAAAFAGLAFAQDVCSQQKVTVTITPTEYVTCGGTVYTTVTQKTTITVGASSVAAIVSSQPAVASSAAESTEVIISTAYVVPSPVPTSGAAASSSQYAYFPNTTSSNGLVQGTFSFELASSSTAAAEASSAVPSSGGNDAPASSIVASSSVAESGPSSSTVAVSSAAAAAASTSAATSNAGANSGEASFYGGNTSGGMCSFSTYSIPSGIFGTALSAQNWDGSANCGSCVSVTGPSGNSIKAMVVDQCPECALNKLDLFQDAFAELADISKGIIDITWSYVDCGISSPIQLHNKEGTSAYWFSMQVVNSNVAVSKLEVSTDGGNTWQGTTRQDYNFFENSSGFGTSTVDVKVTSSSGETITVKNVGVTGGSSVTASSNFS